MISARFSEQMCLFAAAQASRCTPNISEHIADDATGRRSPRHVPRCIAIGGAFVARGACGSVTNAWSASCIYETGGMRRVHLRGHPNILKQLLTHTSGFNLGLLMRQLIGVGTPRSLQGPARRGRDRASRADWGAQGTCYAASAADAGGLTAQGALDREILRRAHRRARNGLHHGQLN